VLVVEHEPEMMLSSDKIIDIGPGAGELGGEVVFQGTAAELISSGAITDGQSTCAAKSKSNRRRIAG